ncbi:hypothetical protein ACFL2C_03665 [Patescibacteria group bacterium]
MCEQSENPTTVTRERVLACLETIGGFEACLADRCSVGLGTSGTTIDGNITQAQHCNGGHNCLLNKPVRLAAKILQPNGYYVEKTRKELLRRAKKSKAHPF